MRVAYTQQRNNTDGNTHIHNQQQLHGGRTRQLLLVAWAPARGEQGGQVPTLEKIRVGMAHPGNFSRGLKTSWQ